MGAECDGKRRASEMDGRSRRPFANALGKGRIRETQSRVSGRAREIARGECARIGDGQVVHRRTRVGVEVFWIAEVCRQSRGVRGRRVRSAWTLSAAG